MNMVKQELLTVVILFYFSFTHFHVTSGERWNTQPKISDLLVQVGYTRPVHMFAENDICGSYNGQKSLYFILKKKFCEMSNLSVAQFVLELCKEKPSVLDLLVKTLFDVDRDGKISYYERRRFEKSGQFK